MKPELIMWGRHPAHCNGQWLQIAEYTSVAQCERRRREGWEIVVTRKGNKPA